MNQPKFLVRSLLVAMFALVGTVSIHDLATMQNTDNCYASFDDFAYRAPLLNREQMQLTLFPRWNLTSRLPLPINEIISSQVYAIATRIIESKTEVWLRVFSSFLAPQQTDQFLVYVQETRAWEAIPAQIANTGVFVEQLFVTSDGRIWGKTNWDPQQEVGAIENVPTLALFDEVTRNFIFAPAALEIPFRNTVFYVNPTQIVLNDQDIFWMFSADGSISTYDPVNRTTQEQLNLLTAVGEFEPVIIGDIAIAPEGTIYFQVYSSPLIEPYYRIKSHTIFQFVPETSSVVPVTLPQENWPIFNGLLVDRLNQLWLGSIGYRNLNGGWTLLHPDPVSFFDIVDGGSFSYLWAPATLFYESSDGRMWFNRFLDTGGLAEGLAWYDPQTDEGCMVTNQYGTVIEDAQRRLWLVAAGNLYQYGIGEN